MTGKRECFRDVIKLIASSLVIWKMRARTSRKFSHSNVSELKKIKRVGKPVGLLMSAFNVKFNYRFSAQTFNLGPRKSLWDHCTIYICLLCQTSVSSGMSRLRSTPDRQLALKSRECLITKISSLDISTLIIHPIIIPETFRGHLRLLMKPKW